MKRIYALWSKLSLNRKINISIGGFVSLMIALVFLIVYISAFSLNIFEEVLKDNADVYNFYEAFKSEKEQFAQLVRSREEEDTLRLEERVNKVEGTLLRFSLEYKKKRPEQYSTVWSIMQSYENYSEKRDLFLEMKPTDENYLVNLYDIYSTQNYILGYGQRLQQIVTNNTAIAYAHRNEQLKRIIALVVLLLTIIFIGILRIYKALAKSVLIPVQKLTYAAEKISRNDFSDKEIKVENKDEIGKLVETFNVMARVTEEQIDTLMENNKMSAKLHQEEIARIELSQRLGETKLKMLKSQIDPHFLFNTLNMISSSAKMEDATLTEAMIHSLSNIFRYNLKETSQSVLLALELKNAKDYLYLQKMRFGYRIQTEIINEVDEYEWEIPSLTLQPLIENAIVHGLSKKEQGGRLILRIFEKNGNLMISVYDQGIGMEDLELQKIKKGLKEGNLSSVGIGVGNICERIMILYQGTLEIYSKKDVGTCVQIKIPKGEQND